MALNPHLADAAANAAANAIATLGNNSLFDPALAESQCFGFILAR